MNEFSYEEFQKEVSRVVKKEDPFDLIAVGAPDDEYDAEINNIASNCFSVNDADTTKKIIKKIFFEAFDEYLPDEKLNTIAARILNFKSIK